MQLHKVRRQGLGCIKSTKVSSEEEKKMYRPDKKDHNIETEHLLIMSQQLIGTKPGSPEVPFEMP